MLFKKFHRTIELNQISIDFPGQRVYYDKTTLWIAIATNIIFFLLSLVVYSFDKQWGFLAAAPLWLLFLPSKIRKLLFKRPIFIFQKDRFYYSLESRWFDKANSKVSYKLVWGTPNISGTILISDLNGDIEIEENIFYLDNAAIFRKEIKQYSSNRSPLTFIED